MDERSYESHSHNPKWDRKGSIVFRHDDCAYYDEEGSCHISRHAFRIWDWKGTLEVEDRCRGRVTGSLMVARIHRQSVRVVGYLRAKRSKSAIWRSISSRAESEAERMPWMRRRNSSGFEARFRASSRVMS